MTSGRPVIIGSAEDEHVNAVTQLLPHASVWDAERLRAMQFAFDGATVRLASQDSALEPFTAERGWIRRLVPPGWQRGVRTDSHEAAVGASWLSLLAGLIRSSTTRWLTPLDFGLVAEGKLTQIRVAKQLGLRTPKSLITSDRELVLSELGKRAVLKPLTHGYFIDEFGPRVVFAQEVAVQEIPPDAWGVAPMLAQERVLARKHFRVVTVAHQVWACELDAEDLPLDWRSAERAHSSFLPALHPNEELTRGALAMSRGLHLGYSSQDWILSKSGEYYVLDVNPGGQWLFLPPEVAASVTRAIASWLGGTQ